MHTQFLTVIRYTSGEVREKMCPVLRLTVLVGVLLSAGPTAGALYPQAPYHPVWPQYGPGVRQIDSQEPYHGGWLHPWLWQLWHFNTFQQQQISQLKMRVNELENKTGEQQKEIDELKPLLWKVMLLESIIGVNLTVDDNLTDYNESILVRLTSLEDVQGNILEQQDTFRQLHGHHNESIQNLSVELTSLTDIVRMNTENISDLRTIQNERANHSDQLESLFDAVESHNTTIGGPLNESFTLVSFLEKLDKELKEQITLLIQKNDTLHDLDTRLEEQELRLIELNGTIPAINNSVVSVENDLELFKVTEQAQAAFSVSCSSCPTTADNSPIVYNDVETNINDSYSADTGCFTAPHNGLYIFYTSLRSDDSSNITVGIYNHDNSLIRATADGTAQGLALVTTELNSSNVVCVKAVGEVTGFSSTFSGWLEDATLN